MPTTHPELPETLGHFRVVEKIGEGGMGEVYRARDERLDRDVAIKVVRSSIADESTRKRFRKEARVLSRLNHPNVETIHEFVTEDDVDFIVTEYVPGESLDQMLAREPLPEKRIRELGGQLADGLAAAHAAGIIHRDLKPSNIRVTSDGRLKILDFGIAKILQPPGEDLTAAATTDTWQIRGTLPYMSPEQLLNHALDERTDIWGAGCVLYEMATGRRPFSGTWAALCDAILHSDPPAPTEMNSCVSSGLDTIILKCLAKDAALRYWSAQELGADLRLLIHSSDTGSVVASGGRPSVAIFPFTNMSGERSDDFLCEGLPEEIINVLTGTPGLRVVARTSSFAAARMGLDARDAGTKLGVSNLLQGSVRRAGNRVRVSAQLVRCADGEQLWTDRYERELADVLMLEDEVAAAVAEHLRAEIVRGPASAPPTLRRIDAEAHQLFLEGRFYFAKGTPDALARAKECYERAIERDGSFALAYDSLAELYWYLGFFGGVQPRDAFSLSTWHALRALELDEQLAETHALLAMLRKELDYNWPEVNRELRRARELKPESPLVRLRYAISGPMPHGDIDEARAEIDKVLQSDPLSLFVLWWSAVMAYLGREFDRCAATGRHMLALEPNYFLGHWAFGIGLHGMEQHRDALPAFRRAHELSGGIPFTLGFLALECGRAGETAEARTLLHEMERSISGSAYFPPFALVLAHCGLGDWDAAFEWLEKSIEARDPLVMPIKTFEFLDPIRDDRRYAMLLRKMRLD